MEFCVGYILVASCLWIKNFHLIADYCFIPSPPPKKKFDTLITALTDTFNEIIKGKDFGLNCLRNKA